MKFEKEFIFKASPAIIYQFLTVPECLVRWFCDNVDISEDVYTFSWDGAEEDAELIFFHPRQHTPDEHAPRFAEWVFGKARHAIRGTKVYSNFVNGHFSPTEQAHAESEMRNYYTASSGSKTQAF